MEATQWPKSDTPWLSNENFFHGYGNIRFVDLFSFGAQSLSPLECKKRSMSGTYSTFVIEHPEICQKSLKKSVLIPKIGINTDPTDEALAS